MCDGDLCVQEERQIGAVRAAPSGPPWPRTLMFFDHELASTLRSCRVVSVVQPMSAAHDAGRRCPFGHARGTPAMPDPYPYPCSPDSPGSNPRGEGDQRVPPLAWPQELDVPILEEDTLLSAPLCCHRCHCLSGTITFSQVSHSYLLCCHCLPGTGTLSFSQNTHIYSLCCHCLCGAVTFSQHSHSYSLCERYLLA
jgi:hypothetical protein